MSKDTNRNFIFRNIDVLIYISSFIDDFMLLPFALTCKTCHDAIIASHRNYRMSCLSYFCHRVAMTKWALDIYPQGSSKVINLAALHDSLDVIIWHQKQKRLYIAIRGADRPCPCTVRHVQMQLRMVICM